MNNFLDIIKSKKFWGGVLTTIGGVLSGVLTFPDAVVEIIKQIGG